MVTSSRFLSGFFLVKIMFIFELCKSIDNVSYLCLLIVLFDLLCFDRSLIIWAIFATHRKLFCIITSYLMTSFDAIIQQKEKKNIVVLFVTLFLFDLKVVEVPSELFAVGEASFRVFFYSKYQVQDSDFLFCPRPFFLIFRT